jgi:hypothetical protein
MRSASTPIPNDPGVVASDRSRQLAVVGDGIATGVRIDLVFRIDPGRATHRQERRLGHWS